MKRSEAFWILNEMYELANEAQKQALDIAQRDIEFVDLMPDVPVQRWIPVTERLPENGQEVFVAYVFPLQHRLTSRYFYSASMYHIDDGNGLVNGPHFENEGFKGMRVTHWMPLPEPPKEDAE